jgi:hypothetical protein
MVFGLNQQDPKDVPGFLQAMGIANTMATFVFANALTKVSATSSRRLATVAIALSWISMIVAGLNYVVTMQVFGSKTGLLDLGLLLWLGSFVTMSILIFRIANQAVNTRITWHDELELNLPKSAFDKPDFGVPLVDDAIRRTRSFGTHIHYPFLFIHDENSPGLAVTRQFAAAGIKAGEAVVYFSFSRPASTIMKQLDSHGVCSSIEESDVYLIDCYSRAYMPEELHGAESWRENILYADPFNPADVYRHYFEVLKRARKRSKPCRAIYETLSDFLKIADAELVMHYLRRTVVYEEMRGIKALYVFWSGALDGTSERYIPWFFSTTLRLKRHAKDARPDLKYQFTIEKIFPDDVCIRTDDSFAADLVPLFVLQPDRIEEFARLFAALGYVPKPYGFLPSITVDRAKHVANFAFFMAAVDHNTHSGAVRYEGTVGGTFYHGSDLLYQLAQAAKMRDERLFLAPRMAKIGDADVEAMFRTSDKVVPADIPGRARIFRECGAFLMKLYGGDVMNLIAKAQRRVAGRDGVVDRLDATDAYADPVAKKANLLCKMLLREGVFVPEDRDHIDISVDHILMTMALRSGMVQAVGGDTLEKKLAAGSLLDHYTVAVLREITKAAYHEVIRISKRPADEIDDVTWSYGRKCLREVAPLPYGVSIASELDDQIQQQSAKPAFIAFMNGLDELGQQHAWRCIRTVNFPFTEYF